MPIIGLSDRGLSFPEIGAIRKGRKETRTRKDGSTYEQPIDLTFFRVEFDEREKVSAEVFRSKYGPQPTEINIILPFNEIERCWDPFLEAYTAGRMVARSDGEKFTYLVDTKTGEIKVKNSVPFTPYNEGQVVGHDYQNKPVKCRPVGRLKVIVPELARAAYLTVMTTSVHDIANISAQLEAFKTLNGGRIAGIPLVLRRRPKMISTPGETGQRVRREKWLLSIEADPEWVKRMLSETNRLALPGNGTALLPETPSPEWDEDIFESGVVEEDEEGFEPPSNPETATEDEKQPAPQDANVKAPAAQTSTNGHGERPYSAHVVREGVENKAKKHKDFSPTKAQQQLLRYGLELCFPGDPNVEDKRYTLLKYLTGEASTKNISGPTFKAIVEDWLKMIQDSGGAYSIDAMAAREAEGIVTAALVGEGQQALFEEPK